MRRSLPLLVLLLAGTASCGRGGPTPQNREPSGGGARTTVTDEAAPPAPASMVAPDTHQTRTCPENSFVVLIQTLRR